MAAAYSIIEKDGDLVCMHFDSGVPWDEALQDLPYPQNYVDEINGKVNAIPDNHMVYLAVTPIAFTRDQLAEYRGNAGTEALQPPWKGRSFDHPDVMTAFANHCQQLISIFSPDYFALAVEANLLIDLNPSEWGAFVVCWFFTRDFDWKTQFQFDDRSPIIRLWKDTGLYDGDGNSRDALEIWKEYLTLNLD